MRKLIAQAAVVFAFFTFLLSCKNEVELKNQGYYFSLRDYFKTEENRLSREPILLEKLSTSNLDSSTQTIDKVNWQKELALFIAFDINKPAWKQQFMIDSVRLDDELSLCYLSLDSSIPVKEIRLNFKEGRLEKISAKKATKNFVFQSIEKWSYSPQSGYSLFVNQQVLGFYKNTYTVRGRFKPIQVYN